MDLLGSNNACVQAKELYTVCEEKSFGVAQIEAKK
jgi:hypothetical protein